MAERFLADPLRMARRSNGGFRRIVPLALFVAAAPAFAQQPPSDVAGKSLEDLLNTDIPTVEAASKRAQKTTDAPASVTIVTSEEIRRHGYRTFPDILKSVRGFYVSYDRNYSFLGVRGFGRPGDYNGRVLMLVDGHRVNDDVYEGALVGTEFPLDLELIERIEIVRGPGASLYGTNAFFAVINVVTRTGEGLGGVEVAADAGSLATYHGRASYGNKFKSGLDLLVSGTLYDSGGAKELYYPEYDDPATGNGIARNADDDRFRSVFGRASYRDLTLQTAYVSRDKRIPTGSFETVFGDTRNKTTDERLWLDLSYTKSLPGSVDVAGRIYYDHYGYDGTYVYDYGEDGEPQLVLNRDTAKGEWWGLEARASRTFFGQHIVSLGGEYRDYLRQDQKNWDEEPFLQYLDDRRSGSVAAVYLQDEFSVSTRVLLSAGIRYDRYSTFGGTLNPRLALIVRPSSKSALKLLYGQAFRAPNAYELYYETATSAEANPDLDPERIKTGEVVYEQYLGERWRFAVSAFYSRIDDLITQTVDPEDEALIMYRNLGAADTKGFEAEAAVRLPRGIEAHVAYAYARATDKDTGGWLTNSPRHIVQLEATAPVVKEKLFAGFELLAHSDRLGVGGDVVPGVVVVNMNLMARKLVRGLELSAGVYNLFDATYADPGAEEHAQASIEQDARTFRAKLTWSF